MIDANTLQRAFNDVENELEGVARNTGHGELSVFFRIRDNRITVVDFVYKGTQKSYGDLQSQNKYGINRNSQREEPIG